MREWKRMTNDASLKVAKKIELELDDSRRLTGPNLFAKKAGAVIDVKITGIDATIVISTWGTVIQGLLGDLDWSSENSFSRSYKGGASLAITAPIDCLYAATEVNEAAWEITVEKILNGKKINRLPFVKRLKKEIEEEKNDALVALQQAAKENNVVFLSDDDHVSIGYGKSCKVFPIDNIPASNEIDWREISDIPVALITGTNGKSTSVRLASAVAEAAGKRCGITSTDYIRVGKKILDRGDYSGPGGARTLLRHPDSQVCFLEVARGGMLRRGIGINQAKSAMITNVSEDHLGEYGINDLNDMVEAKFIVRQAVDTTQYLVLNADDRACVNFSKQLNHNIIWFSLSKDNPTIQQQISKQGNSCYLHDGVLFLNLKGIEQEILPVKDIPITFNGAAKHNIQNAMGVISLCYSLGFSLQDIKNGLANFGRSADDNPGRGNLFDVNGFKVMIDFAHNEQGLNCMAETIREIPAKRRMIMLCQAGDRSDELIKGFVKSAIKANPDLLLICELEDYLRGRQLNEVPNLIHQYALEFGMRKDQLLRAGSTIEGAKIALDWAEKDDLLLLLALDDREEITRLVLNKKIT